MYSKLPIHIDIVDRYERGIIMEESITSKQFIALARFSIPEVREYSELLEAFLYGKVITRKLVDILAERCKMVDDSLPFLKMYFSESLPYLRKARATLILLIQRKKELDEYSEFKELSPLFQSNLANINAFFTKFDLRVEELSKPPTGFDDTQRTLQQRIINPNYDASSQTRNIAKKIAKSMSDTRLETDNSMKAIADKLKSDYENNSFKVNQEVVEASHLFIDGVSNLYNRDAELKLSRERATQLSDLADLELTPRQRKIKKLLAESSSTILSESKTRGN